MKKTEFVNFLEEIIQKLEIASLNSFCSRFAVSAFRPVGVEKRDAFITTLLNSRDAYNALSADEKNAKVFDILGIAELYTAPNVTKLINLISLNVGPKQDIGKINYEEIKIAVHVYTNILMLHTTLEKIFFDALNYELKKTENILSIDLLQDINGKIETQRLIKILQSIENIYGSICEIMGVKDKNLTIHYIESGSSIRTLIKGKIKPIDALATLIKKAWNQLYYPTQSSFDRTMESTTVGLDLLELIKDKEQNKTITHEQAEILRDSIFPQIYTLIKNGVNPTDTSIPIHQDFLLKEITYEEDTKQIEHKKNKEKE